MALLMLFTMLALVAVGIFRSTHTVAAPTTVTIVAAGEDLAPGSRLNFRNLHYIEMPKRYYCDEMFTSSEQVVGYLTKVYLPTGEPVTKDSLFSTKNSFAPNVETNERAITLKLDDEALVDHEIYPGDSIDVIVTCTGKDGKRSTKTACQDVRVLLSTTKEAQASKTLNTSFNKITLAATPQQAELLAEAQETGKIKLTLRNRLSRISPKLAGVIENDLLPARALTTQTAAAVPVAAKAQTKAAVAPEKKFAGIWRLLSDLPAPPPPVQWVVEMFTGPRRDVVAVPPSVH